jgi:thiol-disulfide isomerase/thioredoxin
MYGRFSSLPVLLALLLTSGCSKHEEQQSHPSSQNVAPDNVAEVSKVEKRDTKVPNFSWKDAAGNTVEFDAVRGKATLVNFWATWCGPCKRELPDLVALNTELGNKGIKIIGVSTDRGSNVIEDVRAFVREHGIQYQVVVSSEELEEAFGNVRLLPTSFIIDANGNIVQTLVGPRSKAFFTEALLATAK